MNLPNKLTVFRMVLIPFFMAGLLISFPHNYIVADIIFIVASLTDMLDGKIARKRGLVTDFGKLMDPLADKMLVTAAVIMFQFLGLCHPVAVMIILARDLLITSMRLVAASSGAVLAAGLFGKIKTASQMAAIILIMVIKELEFLNVSIIFGSADLISNIIMWVVAILTLASGIDYVVKYKSFIKTK